MGTPGATPAPPPAPAPLPPGRSRRRRVLTLVLVAAIVVIAGFVGYLLYENESLSVRIHAILIDAPDDVCGLADEPLAYHGYNATGASPTVVAVQVPNLNVSTCTVVGLATNTSGFSVSGANVPFSISGRGVTSLSLSIAPPSRSYSGDLTLVFR
jgi:hypothetical protein